MVADRQYHGCRRSHGDLRCPVKPFVRDGIAVRIGCRSGEVDLPAGRHCRLERRSDRGRRDRRRAIHIDHSDGKTLAVDGVSVADVDGHGVGSGIVEAGRKRQRRRPVAVVHESAEGGIAGDRKRQRIAVSVGSAEIERRGRSLVNRNVLDRCQNRRLIGGFDEHPDAVVDRIGKGHSVWRQGDDARSHLDVVEGVTRVEQVDPGHVSRAAVA